jgi:hypothetical protein
MTTQTAQIGHAAGLERKHYQYLEGGIISREGVVPVGGIANVDMAGINPTIATMVTVQISGNPVVLSAAATPKNLPGAVCWEVPIVTIVKKITEFALLIGANNMNSCVKVQNPGPFPAHYRIIFTNLAG